MMTNLELEIEFQDIEENSLTIFDVYEKLALLEKDYKAMPISKIIKTVYEAYELYHSHKDIADKLVKTIASMDFSNIIESFDLTKIVDQIPTEYKKILAELIASSE